MSGLMHDGEVPIDEILVRALLGDQFPTLARQSLKLVEPWGTDNALWRLGDDLVVRLPRIYWATGQIELEATWLPRIAGRLPVPIPEPIAVGQPGRGYPYRWAIHRWLPGEPAGPSTIADADEFAVALSGVVEALHKIPTDDAPAAAGRARPLADYADSTLAVDVQVVWSPLFNATSRQQFLDVLKVDNATVLRSRGAAVQQACAALPYYQNTYPLIVERSRHKLAALGVAVQGCN